MRSIKKLFEKPREIPSGISEEIHVLEVEEQAIPKVLETEPIYIKSLEIKDPVDIRDAGEELQRGNVVIIDMGSLLGQDPLEVKQSIDRLKEISKKIGGDIGKISDTKIIATPKFIRIQFKKA